MKTHNFLRHVLLEERDDERVLGVIAYELTFLHDYYYSSLPVSYSKSWLPVLSIFISLLSIGYWFGSSPAASFCVSACGDDRTLSLLEARSAETPPTQCNSVEQQNPSFRKKTEDGVGTNYG